MGKQLYLSDEDAERLYHLVRNSLESDDLTEEECERYRKILSKLTK
ncbi:hypothetical protein [Bacillus cereus group sp. BfR-BA-01381]|nr:hypothetical protein [Bacillus cereus group sp. BfR-BA-01381]